MTKIDDTDFLNKWKDVGLWLSYKHFIIFSTLMLFCILLLLTLDASHTRDVFAYGVILFQLLTDQAVLGAQFNIT